MFKNNSNITILVFVWLFSLTALILFFGLSKSHQSVELGTYTPTTIVTMNDSMLTLYKIRPKYDSLRTFIGDTVNPWDSTYSRAYLIPWGDSATAGVFAPIAYGPVVIDSFAEGKEKDTLVLKNRVPLGSIWMMGQMDSFNLGSHTLFARVLGIDSLVFWRFGYDTAFVRHYATWRIR